MGIFSFEPGLAVWTWIAFAILLFLMSKYVYPVLLQNVKDRERAISDVVDHSEEIKRRLDKIEQEHRRIIENAKNEANEILRKTREDADLLKKEIMRKVESEASDILEQAKQRIAEERRIAIESIKSDLTEVVVETAEKVLGHSFLKEDDRQWIRSELDIH